MNAEELLQNVVCEQDRNEKGYQPLLLEVVVNNI